MPGSVSPLGDKLTRTITTGDETHELDRTARALLEGNSLFFPVINYVNFYSPQCPPLTGKTVKQLRAFIQPFIKGIHDVSVTLDGRDIRRLYCGS